MIVVKRRTIACGIKRGGNSRQLPNLSTDDAASNSMLIMSKGPGATPWSGQKYTDTRTLHGPPIQSPVFLSTTKISVTADESGLDHIRGWPYNEVETLQLNAPNKSTASRTAHGVEEKVPRTLLCGTEAHRHQSGFSSWSVVVRRRMHPTCSWYQRALLAQPALMMIRTYREAGCS
jgi:hypothetical protein